jgi:hypothetical protein
MLHSQQGLGLFDQAQRSPMLVVGQDLHERDQDGACPERHPEIAEEVGHQPSRLSGAGHSKQIAGNVCDEPNDHSGDHGLIEKTAS